MGDYPNRTDLRSQPIETVTPHARPGTLPATARSAPAQGQPTVGPGDIPSLDDPTLNPGQPVTAGLVSGPGPGPHALNVIADENPELSILRHLYQTHPNPDLRRLINYLELEA